tara:strand:+ start:497 stop:952 length:456 start_codon:yes stop_codon:yes gene_type:complete
MYKETYKGRYRVANPKKYKGDIKEVVYRSSWELKFMRWCDYNSNVLEWGSETTIIPYKSPVDSKIHRYFVDFYIKVRNKDGKASKYLIEIKPERFTKPPPIPKRKTKRFINEVFTYGTNQAKWKYANEYCLDRGWEFLVLTEKDLGLDKYG